jgi:flagellar FliJ protein
MFVFRLESVMNCRKAAEEKALTEFSDEKRELEKEQRNLVQIQEHKASLIGQLRGMQNEGLKADEIALFMDYIQQMQARQTEQENIVRQAAEKVYVKREALLAAVKDRKIMEALKAQKLQEYIAESNKAEQKQMDETAISRYLRRDR